VTNNNELGGGRHPLRQYFNKLHDFSGKLGDGTSEPDQAVPVDVANLTSEITSVSAGGLFTSATFDARAKCWGNNYGPTQIAIPLVASS